MRVLFKRVLRKHGYPPDLHGAAVQTILQQAEALAAKWAALSSWVGVGGAQQPAV